MSLQEINTQFSRYSRIFGGSLRLVAYLVLILTIACAALAILVIAPFREGQVKGIYWSLILYEEVATRWVLPISGAAVVLLLAYPFIARGQNRKPMPGVFKFLTGLLIVATLAAWVVIGLNLFRTNNYKHVQSLLAGGHLFHIASKLENTQRDMRYIIYSCDQTELNCSQVYSQVFPQGNLPRYDFEYKQTVTLRYDEATRQLVLVFPKFKDRPDVFIPLQN
jgi:uncharacterized membrane protein (UPF0136 family)